jgi:hypothetical protein
MEYRETEREGWKPQAFRKFSKKVKNLLNLALFPHIGKIWHKPTIYAKGEIMLRTIGALVIIIILLGMLTGVIDPLGLWYIVRDVVTAIIAQLRLLFPGIAVWGVCLRWV